LLLYYITDGRQLGSEARLLEKIEEAANAGVDYVQLRERHLSARELERVASQAVRAVRSAGSATKILLNSRIDVALAVHADGVHLRSDDISASEARSAWAKSKSRADCVIAVSCHKSEEVFRAEAHGADFVVFGPVFGKSEGNVPGIGIEALRKVISRGGAIDPKVEAGQTLRMPVFALGGVSLENARECREAGAAGVAAIRIFQEYDIAGVVRKLKRPVEGDRRSG
jgi:thiamine-phosphate pyrophosphorylase